MSYVLTYQNLDAQVIETQGSRASTTLNRKSPTTGEEIELINSSKAAFIKTGFSDSYFNNHFKVFEVKSNKNEKKVTWEYHINGYRAFIEDLISFESAKNGLFVNVHSVGKTIGASKDIKNLISQENASKKMKKCIGGYTSEKVVLKASSQGKASLYLTAVSVGEEEGEKGDREHKEKEERTKRKGRVKGTATVGILPDIDVPSKIGFINLETGKCFETEAMSESLVTPR
jgi:hypothetical protein